MQIVLIDTIVLCGNTASDESESPPLGRYKLNAILEIRPPLAVNFDSPCHKMEATEKRFYLTIRLRARDFYAVIVDEGEARINYHRIEIESE